MLTSPCGEALTMTMAKRSWSDANEAAAQASTVVATNGGSDASIPQISRKIKACAACRKLKIKCQMDEGGPPCRRCSDRSLSCVLSKNLQSIIDEKTQYNDAVIQDIEQLHATLAEIVKKVGLPQQPALQTSILKHSAPSPPLPDRSHLVGISSQDNYGPSCDNSPKISPEDGDLPHVPIHSLYALTKMRALRSPDAPERQRHPGLNDFIARGELRLEDADRLFCLYRDRLDAFMYNIGCRYKSLNELRRKSHILTAATLTVAALHEPQADTLYGVCSTEFRRLTEKSMFDRRVDRDYLRAMCVASYWLSDMSWMLSGYAIRRAAECNLHNSYSQAIAEQSEEAADGARLWYILNICDGHLATLYGRPSILQGDPSMQEWQDFMEAPGATEEDRRLVSQIALLGILGSIRALFGPDRSQPVPRAYVRQISHFSKQLDEWLRQWSGTIPEQHHNIGRFPRKGALLHFHFAKLHLYSHIFRGLSNDTPIQHYFLDSAAEAVSVATSTLDFILTDPDIGAGIVGMPSYLHCMTAFACMFLIKVAVKYGDDLVDPSRVWQLTTSLVHQFRSLPTGRWHLANLMAPGLERMAAMLGPGREIELQQLREGETLRAPMNGAELTDPTLMGPGTAMEGNGMIPPGAGGELFFDYGMSFGLSPVFQFDPTSFMATGDPTMQEFGTVDYEMPRADTSGPGT